jgi:hypothetical protein
MRIHRIIVAAVLLLWGGAVYGQSGTCTPITGVPTTITTPGVYCATGNLTLSPLIAAIPAITVESSAVVVDFNGYRLLCRGCPLLINGPTGVLVTGQKNVIIRNGLISDFHYGIRSFTQATIVEDMSLSNNFDGIIVNGGGSIVRRNFLRLNTLGISVGGKSGRVIDNSIVGESFVDSSGIRIEAEDGLVVGNRLSRLTSGIDYSSTPGATGKYRDNLTSDVSIPFSGGTDAGNNN